MIKKLLYIIIVIIIACNGVIGQSDSLSRMRTDTLIFGRKPYLISEKLLIKNSVELRTQQGEPLIDFTVSKDTILLGLNDLSPLDTFFANYRFYSDFMGNTIGKTYKSTIESKVSYISLDIPQNSEENIPLIPEGLDYSGSFGRGLTAGNSQSLVLNSTFNMQLGGKIGNDIDLRAVISDANIPIQAEGTTQQLREFDQVFIELSKNPHTLIAGDYRLERPEGYFINYSKKLKGLRYINSNIDLPNGKITTSGSVAISGGKFSRNQLQTTEGNQGPYKLQGADNEQFIIVQSGTEKIYIDGQLLTRGETNDYVIFYDRAEIVFTEKQLITKDIRVIAEFEYLAQNYARTISTANATLSTKKHNLSFRLYNETDNKNSTGIIELTEEDKTFLRNAGDAQDARLQKSIYINEDFNLDDIFYKIEINSEGDTILTYSQDSSVAKYQALFTDVGANKGSYSINDTVNNNGRVYRYVGQGNGRYSPVRSLIAPISKQMYSIRDEFNYSKNGRLMTEISLSNFDRNLFSTIDENDDISFANRIEWEHNLKFKKLKQSSFKTQVYGEFLKDNFQFLNPFRNAEFQRDWNLDTDLEKRDELLAGANLSWDHTSVKLKQKSNFNYGFNTYRRIGFYEGNRHVLNSELNINQFQFKTNSSYLDTNSPVFYSTFLRPRFDINKGWKKLKSIQTGFHYDGEYNNKFDTKSDTLLDGSNEYDVLKTYIRTDEKKALKSEIYYSKRYDRIAYNNEQTQFAEADNYGTSLNWQGKNQAVNLNVTYRVLETEEALEQEVQDATNMLGGLDYQYSIVNGLIKGVSNINFNSGQEPKLEFDYREVAKGEGNFIWVDNGDGVQEKNEFQPAPFSDQGNFIQVSLFNNEFIQVYKQDYLQTLRIDPVKWKISENKFKKSIAPLSSQTSLKLSRKDLQDNGIPDFNFYVVDQTDPPLVNFLSSINQSLFWNRGNPKYDIQANYLQNNSSILLTTGTEIRNSEQVSIRYRQNFLKKADVELTVSSNNKGLQNISFPNNNYFISGWESILSAKYRYKSNLELRISGEYGEKNNLLGIENTNYLDSRYGLSYTGKNSTRFDAQVSYNRINHEQGDNPTIELIMLEGLQNGNNFLWEFRLTRRLINNFDLTLNYNGRKVGDQNVIHVGNAQIKATF